jgi:hypothetical protein
VEDLLRSSLVYSQARARDPETARRLIRFARAYIDEHAGKSAGWLRLADGTGFSLESVNYLYATQSNEHPELRDAEYWAPSNLFGGDSDQLTSLIDVIGNIPELRLGEEQRGPFHAGLVADIVRDWVAGYNITEIANRRFSSLETDPVKRVRRAGRYLHTTLVSQVPWGMGALQRVALSSLAQDDAAEVGHVPSLVFYGVRSREAAALRMAGVPRVAAEGLGRQLSVDRNLSDLASAREWVAAREPAAWQDALPTGSPLSGSQARLVWAELAATPT